MNDNKSSVRLPNYVPTRIIMRALEIGDDELRTLLLKAYAPPKYLESELKAVVFPWGDLYKGVDLYTIACQNPWYLKWAYDKANLKPEVKNILRFYFQAVHPE
jgi:hypothetical protein